MRSRPGATLSTLAGACALVLLAVAPALFGSYTSFLFGQMIALAYIAVSLQLCFAYARVLSFSQGTSFACGAYTTLYMHKIGCDFLLTLLVSSVTAAAYGVFVGLIVTRMKGAHTAVIGTLLIASIAYMSANSLITITGGEDGFSVGGNATLLGHTIPLGVNVYTYSAAFLPLCAYLVLANFAESTTFGAVMKAVGQNETRAGQLGYNVALRHLVVFTAASGLCGYGGAVYAFMLEHITSALFDPGVSFTAVLWATVGGLNSPFGALLGTTFIFPITELASRVFKYVDIAIGLVLVMTAIYFPRGISGALQCKYKPMRLLWSKPRSRSRQIKQESKVEGTPNET